MKITLSLLFWLWMASLAGSVLATQCESKIHYQEKDGCLSIQADGVPLMDMLEKLAKSLNADIHLMSPMDQGSISMDLRQMPADAVLRRLLKGHDYAVVYHSGPMENRIILRGVEAGPRKVQDRTSLNKTPQGVEPKGDDIPTEAAERRRNRLTGRMRHLKEQIESGYADRWYEKWSKIRSPKYLTHPRDELARLQNEMRLLEDD